LFQTRKTPTLVLLPNGKMSIISLWAKNTLNKTPTFKLKFVATSISVYVIK
jgi:hypothetical protein